MKKEIVILKLLIVCLVVFANNILVSKEIFAANNSSDTHAESVGNYFYNLGQTIRKSIFSGTSQQVPSWTESLESMWGRKKLSDRIVERAKNFWTNLWGSKTLSKNDALKKYGKNDNNLKKSIEKLYEKSEGENGSPENPYQIEPNQFKKSCGQNKYFLF